MRVEIKHITTSNCTTRAEIMKIKIKGHSGMFGSRNTSFVIFGNCN